jgi:hypothetical protein
MSAMPCVNAVVEAVAVEVVAVAVVASCECDMMIDYRTGIGREE